MAEATPAKKTAAAKKTTSAVPAQPDLYDQLVAAMSEPDDSPAHAQAAAWLEAQITERVTAGRLGRPRNIIEALTEVMRRATHVTKDDRNSHGNFNFRGIDAVVNALGPAMREVGVIPSSELLRYHYGDVEVGQNRTRQAHVQVEVRYSFSYSNGDGHITSLAASVPAEAMDSGDKATAKAMSVAMRIALLQTFALPTTEPDPDHYVYERSAPLVTTNADVYSAISWAVEQDDLDAAFKLLRDRFGADLLSLTLHNRAGEAMRGDRYLDQAEAQVREVRARRAADAQDQAAHAPDEPTARAADPVASARVPGDPDAQIDQAIAQSTGSRAGETQQQKMLRWVVGELRYQAEVHGTPYATYVGDAAADPEHPTQTEGEPLRVLAAESRAATIDVLRQTGQASIAEAYALVAPGPFVVIDQVLETATRERGRMEQTTPAG